MLLDSDLRVYFMIPLTHFIDFTCSSLNVMESHDLYVSLAADMESVTQTAELGIGVQETKLISHVWHSECQHNSENKWMEI